MRSLLIVLCVSLLESYVQAAFLPIPFNRVLQYLPVLPYPSPTAISQGINNIPPAKHSVQSLYDEPQTHGLGPYAPYQQPLQSHEENANEVNAGKIYMRSTAGHLIPVDFTISSTICPLGLDTLSLAHELASWILTAHPAGTQAVNQTIQETVKLSTKDAEYRVTLSLTVGGAIEEGPFRGLMKLLLRSTEALFVETEERGFGTLMQRGSFEEVEFEAWWTWYKVVGGVGRRCES